MGALCSCSASVGRSHLPTAFFISSVPCAAASAGLAQHLTSCRAGPGHVCSASVSPPTAAESLGLLPVCTCEPPWHCLCPTGPCPLTRTAPAQQVSSLPGHGSLAPGTTHCLLVSQSWSCSLELLSPALASPGLSTRCAPGLHEMEVHRHLCALASLWLIHSQLGIPGWLDPGDSQSLLPGTPPPDLDR